MCIRDSLKPEIQEKLIWQERPDTLNELIARAVKIDNTLYDLNNRKKERQLGNTFRGNPRTSHYRSNDRRPAQPRSQGYEDPYGPRPMELDATQQQQRRGPLSDQEKERRRREQLCFRCGKSGHMLKDCRQRNGRSQQQRRNTSHGNESVQINATQDRGAYDLSLIHISEPTRPY